MYTYYTNLGRKTDAQATQTLGRARSMVDLKNAGSDIINSKTMKAHIDTQTFNKQLNEILRSRKGKRQYNRTSMGTMPTTNLNNDPMDGNLVQPKHYPTRKLDQNKLMFNEIFLKPKLDQLK